MGGKLAGFRCRIPKAELDLRYRIRRGHGWVGEADGERENADRCAWGGRGTLEGAERGPCLRCEGEMDGERAAVKGYGEEPVEDRFRE